MSRLRFVSVDSDSLNRPRRRPRKRLKYRTTEPNRIRGVVLRRREDTLQERVESLLARGYSQPEITRWLDAMALPATHHNH